MSKLSALRNALEKLDEAEIALLLARKAMSDTRFYRSVDNQFEVVGDAANIIRGILAREESTVISGIDFAIGQDKTVYALVSLRECHCDLKDSPDAPGDWHDTTCPLYKITD